MPSHKVWAFLLFSSTFHSFCNVKAWYDALVLARQPGHQVHKEYIVDPKERAENTEYAKAMDVVYETKETRYYFSYKIVKADDLELAKGKKGWRNLAAISDQIAGILVLLWHLLLACVYD